MNIIYKDRFYNGFARVRRKEDSLFNFIDNKENILSPKQWFIFCDRFFHDFARAQRKDNLWNFIDTNGNILSPNRWFKWVNPFCHGFAIVQRQDEMWNLIDTNGNILSPHMWFNNISFQEKCFILYNEPNQYFLNRENKTIHKLLIKCI